MTALPTKPRTETFKLQRLLPRHYKILELTAAGHDLATIAETLSVSKKTVALVQRSSIFQAELIRLRQQSSLTEIASLDREATVGKARDILERASTKAATKLEELLQESDPSIQLRSASAILDRVFKSDGATQVVVNITAEQAHLLQIAIKESNDVHKNDRPDRTIAADSPALGTELHQASGLDERPADGDAALSPNDQQVDVHQAPGSDDRDAGHRSVQEQDGVSAQ